MTVKINNISSMAKGQNKGFIFSLFSSLFDTVIFQDGDRQIFVLKNRGDIEEGEFQSYSLSAIRQTLRTPNGIDSLLETRKMLIKRGVPLNVLIVE